MAIITAMTLTDYTSFDEIRAVLGVAAEELEDTTLSLPLYSQQLSFHLSDIYATFEDVYATIDALPTKTPDQAKFLNLAQLYACYVTANDLLSALPLFSAKKITDGKAEVERFTDAYADVRDSVSGMTAIVLKRLRAALALVEPGYTVPTAVTAVFAVSTSTVKDPVTSST